MATGSSVILVLFAGPIVMGAAHSISSFLTAADAAGDAARTEMSVAYGLLLWVCAPIAVVASWP